jgi:hypothetical protein
MYEPQTILDSIYQMTKEKWLVILTLGNELGFIIGNWGSSQWMGFKMWFVSRLYAKDLYRLS